MPFNFGLLFHLLFKAVSQSRNTHARITRKRAVILGALFPFLIFLGILHLIGFLLDGLLFPRYRDTEVRRPLFIVGVWRSGTTFLHRMLARDERNFTCMKLWEILLAPSVTQKKLCLLLGAVDQRLGSPIKRRILAWEERTFGTLHRLHKLSLFAAEEDDPILLNIFSSFFQYFGFPFEDERNRFVWFDTELSARDRARIMGFYRRCVQRHLYVFGKGRRFLSKNPAFSPKVRSLDETFPDAQVVCTVRTPLEAVPSTFSLFSLLYAFGCSPLDPHPMREATLEMLAHWYRYPVQELETWPRDRHQILRYDTLVAGDVERTVLDLYRRFGLKAGTRYRRVLAEQARKARTYRSEHVYSLDEVGLDPEQIVAAYRDVFDRFGFDTRGLDAPSRRGRPRVPDGGDIAA